MLTWWLAACGPSVDFLDRPAAPQATSRQGVVLGAGLRPVALDVAPTGRPGGNPAPERFGPVVPFDKTRDEFKDVDVYRVPLPVHDSLMPTRSRGTHVFGSGEPPGFDVLLDGMRVGFKRLGREPKSWGFDREFLYVGVRKGDPAPDWKRTMFRFPAATQAENDLSLVLSGRTAEDFVLRTMTWGANSATGLFLPAPSSATFSLDIAPGSVLDARLHLVPPAILNPAGSDGGVLVVEGLVDGQIISLGRVPVSPGLGWVDVRLPLDAIAGSSRQLTLRTEPGVHTAYDYLFLEGPAVYVPDSDPERVVLVFIDTLRPDHLGAYGYTARPTSPNLDRLAAGGVVFEHARSVSPWTLPATLATLTGVQPERAADVRWLPESFAEAGFRSEAIVTNAFLSHPFGVDRGWAGYQYDLLTPAPQVVDRALATLEDSADRDLFMMVHFMATHLPYDEPWWWRYRWAGPQPDSVRSVSREFLSTVTPESKKFDEISEYVVARYDQNLAWLDSELGRLFEALGPRATIVVFSDHGEEHWEHGGFEHGHALHEELLRVPLIVRAPGFGPIRVQGAVSLLDVAPTLRELAGLPKSESHGLSLVSAMRGETPVPARPLGFGRPLYGRDAWGVVADGDKWWIREGTEVVYDLDADPGEARNLASAGDRSRFPGALADALGTPVLAVARVRVRGSTSGSPLVVRSPHGLAAAFAAYDPRGRTEGAGPTRQDDGSVRVWAKGDLETPAEFFVALPVGAPWQGLELIQERGRKLVSDVWEGPDPVPSGEPGALLEVGSKDLGATLDVVWWPMPFGQAVAGHSPEAAAELEALGYVDLEKPQ